MRRAVLRSAFHLAAAATSLAATLTVYVARAEVREWLAQHK